MRTNMRTVLWPIILCLCFAAVRSEKAYAKDKKLTPEEVVSEHIKSIGSSDVLAGTKSRFFAGSASVEFISGNVGGLAGQCEFVSEEQKLGIFCRYNAQDYPLGHFAFDGEDVTIGYISQGRRSPLGDFLNRNDSIINVKTEYKVNVRELQAAAGAGGGGVSIDRMRAHIYYVLLEEFGDFREVDGIMLPHSYSLHYSQEGRGGTFMARWTINAEQWSHNTQINAQYYTAR